MMACTSGAGGKSVVAVPEQFPSGLRVLVVDDDVTCLKILDQMLRKCMYNVTSCTQAMVALKLLRERKGFFDIVLSDVHMPDMDGFKLLELVGLEMDLPVIMMSGDGRTNLVMRGIRHGACDYLIKPIRDEELKNIWQHVARKKLNESKEHDHSCSIEDNDYSRRGSDDAEYASSVNEGSSSLLKSQKKRRDPKEEEDAELENDDAATAKKPRVVWSVDLHQQFVSAVNQLGIDKAVPKRILELMNVPGLTRENVASHLQKFRLYLKRLSGVAQQQGGLPNSFCGPVEQSPKLASLGRYDVQALATSTQISPQTLAALHAELLARPTGNLVLPQRDQPVLLQASLPGAKCISGDQSVSYGQPLAKCSSNIPKQFSQSIVSNEYVQSVFEGWPSKNIGNVMSVFNVAGMTESSGNMLASVLQHHQQLQKQHQHRPSILPEASRSITVQPSCLVVPSQSSANFRAENSPVSIDQTCGFSRNFAVDYCKPALQSNCSPSGPGQVLNAELKPSSVFPGFARQGSVSSPISSCSTNANNNVCWQSQDSSLTFTAVGQLEGAVSKMPCAQGSFNAKKDRIADQELVRNPVHTGKGKLIPSRFAVDEHDLPISSMNSGISYGDNNGSKVKQEPTMDFTENAKEGSTVLQHFPPNEVMRVLSE